MLVLRLRRGSEGGRDDISAPTPMPGRIAVGPTAKRYLAESEDGSGTWILFLVLGPVFALAIALEIKQVFSAGRHTNPLLLTQRLGGRFRLDARFWAHGQFVEWIPAKRDKGLSRAIGELALALAYLIENESVWVEPSGRMPAFLFDEIE